MGKSPVIPAAISEITPVNVGCITFQTIFSMHFYTYITKMGSHHAYRYLFLPLNNVLCASAHTDTHHCFKLWHHIPFRARLSPHLLN